MNVTVSDTQTVPESGSISGKSLLFEMIQQSPTKALAILRNAGSNQIDYIFQDFDGSTWNNLDVAGTDLNNSLPAGSLGIKSIIVESTNAKVRLIASASGGSTLDFFITRYHSRADAGGIPILSF